MIWFITKKKKSPKPKSKHLKRISHKSELHTIARSYFNPFDLVFTGGKKKTSVLKQIILRYHPTENKVAFGELG